MSQLSRGDAAVSRALSRSLIAGFGQSVDPTVKTDAAGGRASDNKAAGG